MHLHTDRAGRTYLLGDWPQEVIVANRFLSEAPPFLHVDGGVLIVETENGRARYLAERAEVGEYGRRYVLESATKTEDA